MPAFVVRLVVVVAVTYVPALFNLLQILHVHHTNALSISLVLALLPIVILYYCNSTIELCFEIS